MYQPRPNSHRYDKIIERHAIAIYFLKNYDQCPSFMVAAVFVDRFIHPPFPYYVTVYMWAITDYNCVPWRKFDLPKGVCISLNECLIGWFYQGTKSYLCRLKSRPACFDFTWPVLPRSTKQSQWQVQYMTNLLPPSVYERYLKKIKNSYAKRLALQTSPVSRRSIFHFHPFFIYLSTFILDFFTPQSVGWFYEVDNGLKSAEWRFPPLFGAVYWFSSSSTFPSIPASQHVWQILPSVT